MNTYEAPVDRIMQAMRTVGLADLLALPAYADLDEAAVRDVVAGFGRLASEVIAPTDRIGDVQGATLDVATGRVVVPAELAHAHAEFAKGGWTSLSASAELGGGGFPQVVATATQEMFGSANLALSLNPVLTQSAIELLERWGDERQQRLFLARLLDGTWTGTMNLTEPDAGSDVGAVRTTATPLDDGRWAISGTKIYITWGEHDLTDNIVHLVLARTPGAPAGTRGISLFLVPKVMVDDAGRLGERNGVRVASLEHKLGIHASPTCVLSFDGAIGEMVGPEFGGMAAMFSMMNPARLAIGVQGFAIGERAYQQAYTFAHERRQGRAPGATGDESSPIVDHPDVQRMLASIATLVDAARLLVFATAAAADVAKHHPDEAVRAAAQRRVDLFTPLAKAWSTDVGVTVASTAVQVFGGMGFVEETGIAQRYRDARIAPIYEGTNGIQAIDLVGRKVGRDGGAAMGELLAEVSATVAAASEVEGLRSVADALATAQATLATATEWVVATQRAAMPDVLAGATAYLELASVVAAGHLLIRQALLGSSVDTARAQLFAVEQLDRWLSAERIAFGASTIAAAIGR